MDSFINEIKYPARCDDAEGHSQTGHVTRSISRGGERICTRCGISSYEFFAMRDAWIEGYEGISASGVIRGDDD